MKAKKLRKRGKEPTEKEIVQMLKDGVFDKFIRKDIEKEAGFKIEDDIWKMGEKYTKEIENRQMRIKKKRCK